MEIVELSYFISLIVCWFSLNAIIFMIFLFQKVNKNNVKQEISTIKLVNKSILRVIKLKHLLWCNLCSTQLFYAFY